MSAGNESVIGRLTLGIVGVLPVVGILSLVAGCNPAGDPALSAADKSPSPASSTAPQATKQDAKNWPLFRGDSLSSGIAKSSLPEKPELLWKFEVDNGAFEGTAAIVNGVAYIGDLDGSVFALELSTGKKQWEYETDSGFIASAAVQDDLLYIGDYDGRVHCLDTAKGTLQWLYETDAEIDSSVNFYQGNVLVGSQDATLYCLKARVAPERKKGELVWKHAIEDQIRCSPTIVDDRCFVAGCDGKLHIIDLKTGKALAGVEIDGPTGVTPAVRGDYVYFGTEGGVFYAIHWKEAVKAWTYEDGTRSQPFRSCPAVSATHVVFGGRSKQVYALSPGDGKEIWKFAAKQRVDSSPVIVGKRVFVGSADGRIYGLALKDGAKVWEYEAGGGFTGSPAVADGKLVIASDDGVVYCFGAKKGS